MAVLAGAGAAVLAVVAIGAVTLTGGSGPQTDASQIGPAATEDSGAIAALGPEGGTDVNTMLPVVDDLAANETTTQADAAAEALRKEKARSAAAEAKLAAREKAARAAPLLVGQQARTPAQAVTTNTTAQASSASSSSGGVSRAKMSEFYSIVDDARSMAKRVMRSGNSENARLAKSYDANLKTLRDSIRGVQSDREADRLIKQANQTRAYVQFLARQQ